MHVSAKVEVDRIMRTEAPLLFPPGQVIISQYEVLLSDIFAEDLYHLIFSLIFFLKLGRELIQFCLSVWKAGLQNLSNI